MGDFCQGNLVVSFILKMNKEYKGNLIKRYMVCLFNKFVCYFLEQFRFEPRLQKTFSLQMKVMQNNTDFRFST